jgi:hypothetical protein
MISSLPASVAKRTSQHPFKRCRTVGSLQSVHSATRKGVTCQLRFSKADCPLISRRGYGGLAVGLEVGGYNTVPDWPKMGPSLLIATSLILAIRTAKWPATFDKSTANPELDREIEYAAYLASRVMSSLMTRREGILPQTCEA